MFASVSGADKTLVLRNKDCKFYIEHKKKAKIKENDIIVGERKYAGTTGLWEFIVATTPDDKIFTNGDYDNYAEIMHSTNALRRNNDKSETKPKAKKIWKWKHILKPIWDEKDLYTGKGLTTSVPSIILRCDPIALVERLDILIESKAAGNAGVRNEFVLACDELLRQNLIDKHTYKQQYCNYIMLITKRTYKKKYVNGGAGTFGSIGNFFARMFSSNAAK